MKHTKKFSLQQALKKVQDNHNTYTAIRYLKVPDHLLHLFMVVLAKEVVVDLRTLSYLNKNQITKIILLECTSNYPAKSKDIYLKNIDFLKGTFNHPVGFSDHTIGIHHSIAAAGIGARFIERHFTLDNTLSGPDQKLSTNPAEMKQ